MHDVRIIETFQDPTWMKFIEQHTSASIFHHPLWIKVIEETYGYPSFTFGVFEDHRLVGILPLLEVRSFLTGTRAVCLPFTDHCYV